jgi:hypothetical protein
MKYLTLLLLLLAAESSLCLDLQGRWRENQGTRTGLNDFLYEMGKNKLYDQCGSSHRE